MNKVVTVVVSAMTGAALGAGFTGKAAYRKTKELEKKCSDSGYQQSKCG